MKLKELFQHLKSVNKVMGMTGEKRYFVTMTVNGLSVTNGHSYQSYEDRFYGWLTLLIAVKSDFGEKVSKIVEQNDLVACFDDPRLFKIENAEGYSIYINLYNI